MTYDLTQTGNLASLADVKVNGSIEITETALFTGIQFVDTTDPSFISVPFNPTLSFTILDILDLELADISKFLHHFHPRIKRRKSKTICTPS